MDGMIFGVVVTSWWVANYVTVQAVFPGCEPMLVFLGAIGSSIVTALVAGGFYGILSELTDWNARPLALTMWLRRRQHAMDLATRKAS